MADPRNDTDTNFELISTPYIYPSFFSPNPTQVDSTGSTVSLQSRRPTLTPLTDVCHVTPRYQAWIYHDQCSSPDSAAYYHSHQDLSDPHSGNAISRPRAHGPYRPAYHKAQHIGASCDNIYLNGKLSYTKGFMPIYHVSYRQARRLALPPLTSLLTSTAIFLTIVSTSHFHYCPSRSKPQHISRNLCCC